MSVLVSSATFLRSELIAALICCSLLPQAPWTVPFPAAGASVLMSAASCAPGALSFSLSPTADRIQCSGASHVYDLPFLSDWDAP